MPEDKKTAEQQEKKSTIPRGPAATAAKNKYRDKNYDRMELTLPKGMKAKITERVAAGAASSNNAYVAEAIKEKMEREDNA